MVPQQQQLGMGMRVDVIVVQATLGGVHVLVVLQERSPERCPLRASWQEWRVATAATRLWPRSGASRILMSSVMQSSVFFSGTEIVVATSGMVEIPSSGTYGVQVFS